MTMMIVTLLSIGVASAQTRLISGKVTDSKGVPVPGATVKAKSGAAVAADEKGNFQINAQTGDVLTVTSIDFGLTTAKVGAGSSVNIALFSKENKLEEVVAACPPFKIVTFSISFGLIMDNTVCVVCIPSNTTNASLLPVKER